MNKSTAKIALITSLVCFLGLGQQLANGQSKLSENTNPDVKDNIDLTNLPTDMDLLFPLTPQEKIEIRERQMEDQTATYMPLREVTPIRNLTSISGNADRIIEVFVTPDYPTSIVFTDITGQPWPIRHVGQTSSLAQVEEVEGSENALLLMANNGAGRKSISVFLQDLGLPVTLTVTGKNTEYHALKHIKITERGPNAPDSSLMSSSSGNQAPNFNPTGKEGEDGVSLDHILNKLAYKVTPEGFKKLKTSDSNVDAWINNNDRKHLYVMTDYKMVSPAPIAGARSVTALTDDVRIYILPRINPMMALDATGKRVYLSFKER
jgi:intracellular multiplication protein IcmK